MFRSGVNVGVDVTGDRAARAVRRGRAGDRRHRRRATCRCRAASSAASTRRWSTCRRPTGSRSARTVDGPDPRRRQGRRDHRRRRHRRRLPGHRASGRGPRSVTQLEIMPQPGDERADRPAVADVPDDLPGLLGPRGGRRAGLRRRRPRSSSATTTATSARCGWSRSSSTTAVRSRSRAPSARSRPSWCCSRWASSVRSGEGCSSSSGSSSTSAATSRATTATSVGARRVRRR